MDARSLNERETNVADPTQRRHRDPMLNPAPIQIGASHFCRTNPPREDWARDCAVAAEDGHTLFRHWFPWNAVEVGPGRFDCDDFDRQLDLAAQRRINTVIGEISTDYPEWLYYQYPHVRCENRHGASAAARCTSVASPAGTKRCAWTTRKWPKRAHAFSPSWRAATATIARCMPCLHQHRFRR